MLKDKEMFDTVETILRENGQLTEFERKYGKTKGRMMITLADIPSGIDVVQIPGKNPQAFEASFDFYDATVGLAIFTDSKKLATGVWVTSQEEDAVPPAEDWIEFAIEKLMESIAEDGSYGIPIYSFINDTCDMTIVPASPD